MENKDIETYLDYYQEDWKITFHSTGKVMRLEELSNQIGNWMVASGFEQQHYI